MLEDFESDERYISKQLDILSRTNKLANHINKVLGFEVQPYILMDLVEGNTYEHFCLMINLNKMNNGITDENAISLKEYIKKECHVQTEYSILLDSFINIPIDEETRNKMKEAWKHTYYEVEMYNLKEIFSEDELDVIKRLGIEIKDKIYTEYEFDILEGEIGDYYIDPEYCDEELEVCKDLSTTNVTNKEYAKLLRTLNNIDK